MRSTSLQTTRAHKLLFHFWIVLSLSLLHTVRRVSVGTIGVATVNLVGTARNLRTAADIAGTYAAASASVAIVGGGKVAKLQNEKGVILELHGVQLGLEASLSLSGMTIALQ